MNNWINIDFSRLHRNRLSPTQMWSRIRCMALIRIKIKMDMVTCHRGNMWRRQLHHIRARLWHRNHLNNSSNSLRCINCHRLDFHSQINRSKRNCRTLNRSNSRNLLSNKRSTHRNQSNKNRHSPKNTCTCKLSSMNCALSAAEQQRTRWVFWESLIFGTKKKPKNRIF